MIYNIISFFRTSRVRKKNLQLFKLKEGVKKEQGTQVKKNNNKNKNKTKKKTSTIKRGSGKRNKTTTATTTRIPIPNYFVLETFQCEIPGSRKR